MRSATRRAVMALCALASACSLHASTSDGDGADSGSGSSRELGATPDAAEAPRPIPDLALSSDLAISLGAGFVDVTATLAAPPPWMIAPNLQLMSEPEATTGSFGDLDGDGWPEVVLSTTRGPGPPYAYRYDRATHQLVAAPDLAPTPALRLFGLVDLDDDGALDGLGGAVDGAIAWGLGGGKLATPQALAPETPFLGQYVFNLGFALDDLDDDGWLDVVMATRPGCGVPQDLRVLLRTGTRRWADRSELLAQTASVSAYSVMAWSPHAPSTEKVIAGLGQGCGRDAAAFYRSTGPAADGWPRFAALDPIPDGSRFTHDPGMTLVRPPLTSFSPMGAAVADLDDDGLFDVAIGFDPIHAVFQGTPAWPIVDRTDDTGLALLPADGMKPMLAWGIALLDIDRDGRRDYVAVHGNDFSAWLSPTARIGPQEVTLHLNRGDFRFIDATTQSNLGRRGQWRSLAVGDLDLDGDPDLIVGGQGELPRLWRNEVEVGNHSLAIRLRGTSTNRLGVGARVDAWVDAKAPAQHHLAIVNASPSAASEPLIFVGAGASLAVARVRITWPSGTVQELADLATGRVHVVEEPPLFALTPASRHLPADGKSACTVRVTPRSPDGSLRAGAAVSARLFVGNATLAAPVRDAMGWTITLTAPAAPGSAVLELRVDGVAVPLRPRVWFD